MAIRHACYTPLSTQRLLELLELLGHPGARVGRYPGQVVVTLGVDPEAVVGDPVPLVTALVEGRQGAQDLGDSDPVCLAKAEIDRNTAPVQEVVDDNANSLI